MNNSIKTFMLSLALILLAVITLLVTTLLLDVDFIRRFFARQMVVYLLMLVEAFIFARILFLFNNVRF